MKLPPLLVTGHCIMPAGISELMSWLNAATGRYVGSESVDWLPLRFAIGL
jgi:hypothetical protein